MAPEGNGADTAIADGAAAETGIDVIEPTALGRPAANGGAQGGQGAEPGGGQGASWELPAEPRTAARARALTARALDAWHVTDPGDVDDVVLMVDELVTNAVVHGTGPVRLRLRLDGGRLTGEVGDADPAPPGGIESGIAPGIARPAPPVLDWAEAGRGLLLVTALATGFGARCHAAGKTVWFTRDLHGAGPGNAPVTAAAAATAPAHEPARPPRR
ncbi:ATP-binding protein [Actinomadura physcomitrii]|uniref:ATP-binding protein n=1 Tax=Actinomadura physcomitrii TaxID=2650748 RepID=UPI00136909BF|nr:ATP-binding protein [Actinomadura physcomitrii]